jgi:excisionase family DNA binding protein
MSLTKWSVVGVWLAEYLSVPRTTLQDAVADGRLPSQKLGSGQTVVRINDAKKWADREHRPKSEG